MSVKVCPRASEWGLRTNKNRKDYGKYYDTDFARGRREMLQNVQVLRRLRICEDSEWPTEDALRDDDAESGGGL